MERGAAPVRSPITQLVALVRAVLHSVLAGSCASLLQVKCQRWLSKDVRLLMLCCPSAGTVVKFNLLQLAASHHALIWWPAKDYFKDSGLPCGRHTTHSSLAGFQLATGRTARVICCLTADRIKAAEYGVL